MARVTAITLVAAFFLGCGSNDSEKDKKAATPRLKHFDAAKVKADQESWAKENSADIEVTNSIGMKLRLIPPGEFMMGSPKDEKERLIIETQHRVRLTKPFYIGVHEVTQEQYESVTGKNPAYFSPAGIGKEIVAGLDTSEFPVEWVSWFDAIEFCNKLSKKEGLSPYYSRKDNAVTVLGGKGYRLPTEAEWEYACRAGTTTPFHFGPQCNGKEANVRGNYGTTEKGPSLRRPTTVGSYPPNAFGLCDMHGNIWEWCQDRYGLYGDAEIVSDPVGPLEGDRRVLRGGSSYGLARNVRSAFRADGDPGDRYSGYGFRVARTYP